MEIAKLILDYIKVLIWPITVIVMLILFRTQIRSLFGRLKKADLPGGISLETFPEHIREARELSVAVGKEKDKNKKDRPSIPLTDANAKMLNFGLQPSPTGLEFSHYRILAEQDPNLALAGLRMEVETMLKNLSICSGFFITKKESSSRCFSLLRISAAAIKWQTDLYSLKYFP